ncbi:tRNA (adenosine(37)-N6)-threonylcarbamoyltransferase complex ATPase subunit type 1 TsaE [Thermophagus xiamenensis]|uniref:tRNA threonylcarbamoyladenosine biosynthesis protein TsaE n=1 Tax=Thermophagus xiamenensis TaxID=385682 RepID=A0A1I1Y734_9BACT|nr:tRNA (adenosine(37)-N6)-threonylcarbamoyltransferase complex ATPase subunit type 1 TsaE [Thermophagus xiamenensis]SFE15394.1 tRNA threonylcarbamoyladenosine biosynthesis protein TsaE [Thermophagus xiamenensis]
MEKTLIIHSEGDIDAIAREFLPVVKEKRIIAFHGNMGVGKTTFIKGLCRALGVVDPVTSPSFAIVNKYVTSDNQTVYHFDFYRLKNVSEVFDIGYEDYFFGDDICLIEWPEKIAEVLPDDRLDVWMTENADGSRSIKFSV